MSTSIFSSESFSDMQSQSCFFLIHVDSQSPPYCKKFYSQLKLNRPKIRACHERLLLIMK